MYQSVIRDSGGSDLVRIQPNICDRYHSVPDGSILLVPSGTVAYVSINGHLNGPYRSGRYELFTGVSPIATRLRNIMTAGDSAIIVSVYYISTEIHRFMQLATGEILFVEKKYGLPLKAYGTCNLVLQVSNSLCFLNKLIGGYNESFTEDDIEPCIRQLLLSAVREKLSEELQLVEMVQFNSMLGRISRELTPVIRECLQEYGLNTVNFSINAINIPETERQPILELEKRRANGRVLTEAERYHMDQIWGGNAMNRTLAEAMTGNTMRGMDVPVNGNHSSTSGNGSPMSMMAQWMLMMNMMPSFGQPIRDMAGNTDLFGNANTENSDVRTRQSGGNSRNQTSNIRYCPTCNSEIPSGRARCPVCGTRV